MKSSGRFQGTTINKHGWLGRHLHTLLHNLCENRPIYTIRDSNATRGLW